MLNKLVEVSLRYKFLVIVGFMVVAVVRGDDDQRTLEHREFFETIEQPVDELVSEHDLMGQSLIGEIDEIGIGPPGSAARPAAALAEGEAKSLVLVVVWNVLLP